MVPGSEKVDIITKQVTDENVSNYPYHEVIGSLLYIAATSKPDIAYVVNMLSHHQSHLIVQISLKLNIFYNT